MSTTKHVPLGATDAVGTVRLCDCCLRPWVYRKLPTPFGPMQKFMGQTVLAWTPETLRERLARRWWQLKLRFKRTPTQKVADDRAERREAELRRGGQSDPRATVPRLIPEKPLPTPTRYTFFEETTETTEIVAEPPTSELPDDSVCEVQTPAAVPEEMKKRVWEE